MTITLFLLANGLRRDRLSGMGGDMFRFLPICGGVRLAAAEYKVEIKQIEASISVRIKMEQWLRAKYKIN